MMKAPLRGLLLALVAATPAAGALALEPPAAAQSTPREAPAPKSAWGAQPDFERRVLAEINRIREVAGRGGLRLSPRLWRPARAHAKYLALRGGALRHESPDGGPFWQRLVRAGYPSKVRMSENLAMLGGGCRPEDPREVVRLWLGSPPHRANLLDPKIRQMGVGAVSTRACATTVYVADFGG